MPGSNLALRLSPGWRTVPPRTGDYRVLWTRGQHLFIDETDLGRPAPLGLVGGLDCPIAVDQQRGLAYRYCCQETAGRRDYSQIREFDVHTGLSRTACKLPLNQWVVWMCRLISGKGMLCGLVATDQPGARVEITHQLGFFDVNSGGVIRLDLPRDAFSPLDAHPGRREVLFHGIEGFQLISFRGERKRRLAGRNLPAGRGGAFHPTEPLVVLGGGKLVLWDLRDGQLVELRATGQYPLFTRDGRGFWFSESSADLWYYDLETREATRILEIAGYRNPEKRRRQRR